MYVSVTAGVRRRLVLLAVIQNVALREPSVTRLTEIVEQARSAGLRVTTKVTVATTPVIVETAGASEVAAWLSWSGIARRAWILG